MIRQDQIKIAQLQSREIVLAIPDLGQPADNSLPAEGFTDQLRIIRVIFEMKNRKEVAAPRSLAAVAGGMCLRCATSVPLGTRVNY